MSAPLLPPTAHTGAPGAAQVREGSLRVEPRKPENKPEKKTAPSKGADHSESATGRGFAEQLAHAARPTEAPGTSIAAVLHGLGGADRGTAVAGKAKPAHGSAEASKGSAAPSLGRRVDPQRKSSPVHASEEERAPSEAKAGQVAEGGPGAHELRHSSNQPQQAGQPAQPFRLEEPVQQQAQQLPPQLAQALPAQALGDPSLRLSVFPRAVHLSLDAGPAGTVAVHLRVHAGVADVRVSGAAAHLIDAQQIPELQRALQSEGLSLGQFSQGAPDRQGGDPELSAGDSRPTRPPDTVSNVSAASSGNSAAASAAGRIDIQA